MSAIINVWTVTEDVDGISYVFDDREQMLDFVRDTTCLSLGCLEDTVVLTVTQGEMERSQFDLLKDPMDL